MPPCDPGSFSLDRGGFPTAPIFLYRRERSNRHGGESVANPTCAMYDTFVMSAKYISIIGPVAVGKTTLAEILASAMDARLLREEYESNPFLAESLRGEQNLALPSQLYFLFMRVRQLAAETFPSDGLVVTDYGYSQDRLYAQLKLTAEELRFYDRLRQSVDGLVTPPNVVIHLDASVETLLGRIQARGRDFETAYDSDYLQRLRRAHFNVSLPVGCKKIFVDCEKINLLDAGRQKEIIEQIREVLS